jgi:iron(III) transport system substrate-binding protein
MHSLRIPSCVACVVFASSCGQSDDLVVYCSLDQEFAEPLIRSYEHETGLNVHAEFDLEANKTVGLVQRLREEHARPRCDVFWSNEPGHTAQLGVDGFLDAYDSSNAADIPPQFRDRDHKWTGFGARARILIVNTDVCDPKQVTSMWDLIDPKWAGKVTMAKPTTGTTLTHMAALYAVIGEAKAEEYVRKISELGKAGAVNIANDNSTVAVLVGDGKMAFGWTDTDDCQVAIERGAHVVAVYPDARGIGTLFLPNTIALVHGAPHADAAKRFIDWVLRPETERLLAFSRSAQIPVRPAVARPATVAAPGQFKALEVDYRTIGAEIEKRSAHLRELFID